MGINNSQNGQFGTELSASMTGSTVSIGSLTQNPTHICFANHGNATVSVYVNQTSTVWKTFAANEIWNMELRAAHGIAPNFTFPIGTTFYGNGASGTFSIAYIYAQTQ